MFKKVNENTYFKNRLRGEIKRTPEDFFVKEKIPSSFLLPVSTGCPYVLFFLEFWNWDKNKFIKFISNRCSISKENITYAGLKDKKAVTQQYFCFLKSFEDKIEEELFKLKSVIILNKFYSKTQLNIGDLEKNYFEIKVYCKTKQKTRLLQKFKNSETIFFFNFFGSQRFGKNCSNLALGKLLLERKYSLFLRKYFKVNINFKNPERRILFLPRRVLSLFARSLQSNMFNFSLLDFVKKYKTAEALFKVLQIGDKVASLSLPGSKPTTVTTENYSFFKKKLNSREVVQCLELISESTKGWGRLKVFKTLGLKVTRTYRRLIDFVTDFRVEERDSFFLFSFSMNKGCYATSFLNEYFLLKK